MRELDFIAPIRCYHGAFDSVSQRVLDAQEKALADIRTREPETHVTSHSDGTYVVHVWGRCISGYRRSRGAALSDALDRMSL